MQVQPLHPVEYVAQSSLPANPILAAVGPRFALVPKIYPLPGGCDNQSLPQSVSVVAVGDIQSPMHLKQVVNQVNSSAQPAPFTSHISQSTCLCLNSGKGLFSEQQVTDAGGSPVFSLEVVPECCGLKSTFSVVNAQKQPMGSLSFNQMPCGIMCSYFMCAFLCRTPTVPEWTWLAAIDPHNRERLTFRVPAQEGQCMMCYHRPVAYGNCCATLPDMPFHDHTDVYGPTGQPGVVGTIDVRGAYGWDSWLCCHSFGARPELMTTINLTQQLSFEDTALAIQMALYKTQTQLEWRDHNGYKRQLPFLSPGQVTMA